jgi:hypothetical protein
VSFRFSEEQLARQVPAVLASLLDLPEKDVTTERVSPGSDPGFDLILRAAGQTFVAQLRATATLGAIAAQARDLVATVKQSRRPAIPLIVVPFMTEAGRRAATAAGASWFDLSGNAHIVGTGLRVIVDGRPNEYRKRGRPASVFAPKSARVVRWLLMHPERAFTQKEIAQATDMTEGFVSRIVRRLEADNYVNRLGSSGERNSSRSGYASDGDSGRADGDPPGGALKGRRPVRVSNPSLLLDAWREGYEFDRHTIIQGHIAARSGDALARFVGDTLVAEKVEHAATGLAAAWQLTQFAAFRIATFFVTTEPSPELERKLGFRRDTSGANTWLVVPDDRGVLQGAEDRAGLHCVHPVQAYVDLKGHPERAAEAAERLRAEFMNWKHDA